jgi:hypothetical protein
MFIAILKTKNNEEITVDCETFNAAWSTLHKLAEDAKTTIIAGEILQEWCGIDGFNVCTSVASMRLVK